MALQFPTLQEAYESLLGLFLKAVYNVVGAAKSAPSRAIPPILIDRDELSVVSPGKEQLSNIGSTVQDVSSWCHSKTVELRRR